MTCLNKPSSYQTGEEGDLQVRTKPTMRNRMLRSVLVAAFSAVVAFGAVVGLSGVSSDTHKADGTQYVADEVVGDESAVPADSRWD